MKRRVVIAATSLALASCKGEPFEVVPCLDGDKLAFEVGTLSAWFGLTRVHPRVSEIWVAAIDSSDKFGGLEAVWKTDSDSIELGATERRDFIRYGEQFPDMKTKTKPQTLRKGAQYRVIMRFGGHDGMADFTFDETLSVCSRGDEVRSRG